MTHPHGDLRTYRDVAGLLGPVDLNTDRPEWADYAIGEEIAFRSDTHGVLTAPVAGYSVLEEYRGLPCVWTPGELSEEIDAALLAISEERHVPREEAPGEDDPELVPDGGISHLQCTGCEDTPTVALIRGSEHLVCHCTHVDGEIEPVALHGFDTLPERWAWSEPVATDVGLREDPPYKYCALCGVGLSAALDVETGICEDCAEVDLRTDGGRRTDGGQSRLTRDPTTIAVVEHDTDDDRQVRCPDCNARVSASKGGHPLPEGAAAERTHGWHCSDCSNTFPCHAHAPSAPFYNDQFVAVEVAFRDGTTRLVPVPETAVKDGGHEFVTDGGQDLRTYRDTKGLMGPVDLNTDRPEWADYAIGEEIAFETPADEIMRAPVIGYSTREDYRGRPAVWMPEALFEYFEQPGGVLVVTEEYHVPREAGEVGDD